MDEALSSLLPSLSISGSTTLVDLPDEESIISVFNSSTVGNFAATDFASFDFSFLTLKRISIIDIIKPTVEN